jgi:hypothetical protein
MAIKAPVDIFMDPDEGPAAPASESIADGASRDCNGAMTVAKATGVMCQICERRELNSKICTKADLGSSRRSQT